MKPTGSNSFKGRRSHSGRSVKLNEGLDKRLASYAAAANAAEVGRRARGPEPAEVIMRGVSAVGVGLLLSAGPASARIVYTPAYINVVSVVSGFNLDLNHDGIADFRFGFSGSTLMAHLLVSARQPGNAILGTFQGVLGIAGTPGACAAASALPAGHRIGPGSKFGQYGQMASSFAAFIRTGGTCSQSVSVTGKCGYWGKAQGRFLGFEFTIRGQKHFGWARLNSTVGRGVDNIATLTGYAYETEPNKPIRAGDTGPVADVREPEMHSAPLAVTALRPATLGVLASGSAGLDIWRKQQEQ
jgi:hypothetical protein